MMRTTPLVRVAEPYDDTAMKSNSTGQVDRAGEIAHEHERALEHTDEQRWTVGVVGGDLLAQPEDSLLELLGGHHHCAQRVGHGRHGTA